MCGTLKAFLRKKKNYIYIYIYNYYFILCYNYITFNIRSLFRESI